MIALPPSDASQVSLSYRYFFIMHNIHSRKYYICVHTNYQNTAIWFLFTTFCYENLKLQEMTLLSEFDHIQI